WIDAASGGLVVLIQALVFLSVYLGGPRHGLLRRLVVRWRRRSWADAGAGPASAGGVGSAAGATGTAGMPPSQETAPTATSSCGGGGLLEGQPDGIGRGAS